MPRKHVVLSIEMRAFIHFSWPKHLAHLTVLCELSGELFLHLENAFCAFQGRHGLFLGPPPTVA